MAGHDIDLTGHILIVNSKLSYTEGVLEAVIEFVTKNNLKLYVLENDWWCVKKP